MYFSMSFIQMKVKDNYIIILSYLDADFEEVFKLLVETSAK